MYVFDVGLGLRRERKKGSIAHQGSIWLLQGHTALWKVSTE